jgi:peptide/nickel transport system permease protein
VSRRLSAALLLLLTVAAIFVSLRPGYSYAAQDRDAIMAGASAQHWTGTDQLGRDRTTRMGSAVLLGLSGAAIASVASTGIAAVLGSLTAFLGRSLAFLVMLVNDAFLALPWLFLLMIVRSGLPLTASPIQSAVVTFLTLAALGWPACTRTVYQRSRQLRAADWMIQARAAGLGRSQIIRRHLLPQLRPLLLTQFLISIPVFLIAEANLGTLGLGVAEPLPSWGAMLLELDQSALLTRSPLNYLPIALLVSVLLLFEMIAVEV